MDDFLTSVAIAVSPELKVNRLETLNSLLENKKSIVITNLMGYLRFLPTKDFYKNSFITVFIKCFEDIYEKNKLEVTLRYFIKRKKTMKTNQSLGV